jgi:peptide/nickel transport system permease protein
VATDSDKQTSGSLLPKDYKTYGEIVWEQFKKYKLSYWSLWGVAALFVLAIFAPILSLNVPFYISIPEGTGPANLAGVSFPWFKALFDVNFFESGVDIFFNSLIFTVPVVLAAWFFISPRWKKAMIKDKYKVYRTNFWLASSVVVLIAALIVYMVQFSQPYVDYQSISKMDGVSSIYPLLEFSYRDVDLSSVGVSPNGVHWLGTDDRGRDVFTRMLYGTRISLTIGILAVAIYTAIGMVLGSIGGFFGGRVDLVVLRLIEVMLCFPSFFLILTLRGFVENASVFHIMIIIGVTGWTGIARLVRGEFLRLRRQDFVQAAIALGYTRTRIIFRHVLPNALGPVLVSATFGVAGAIILEASLAFLGLGPTTAPSWGQILTVGRQTKLWALILAPGFAIFVTVSLLNLVGEGVRDALDPKMRR